MWRSGLFDGGERLETVSWRGEGELTGSGLAGEGGEGARERTQEEDGECHCGVCGGRVGMGCSPD